MPSRPLLIGHRGYPAKFPENTLLSFLAALYYGTDGVELDVWLSGDGHPVVIHDEDTGRVSSVRLEVKKSTLRELRSAYLGAGQVIPTLGEVFKHLPKSALVLVEVKDVDVVEEAVRLVREHGREESTVLISFIPEALEKARSLSETIRLGLNVDSLDKAGWGFEKKGELALYSLNPPVEGLEALGEKAVRYLSRARELGLKIFLWTVNDAETALKWFRLVDAVMTDNVEAIREVLHRPGRE